MPSERVDNCSSCGAAIVWCRFSNGSRFPRDAEPSADGNIAVDDDGTAFVVPKADLFQTKSEQPLYKSHFATCKDAANHRRKK